MADMRTIRDVTGADPIGVYMTSTGWSNWVWADDVFLTVAWADAAQDFMMDKYTELQPGLDFRQLNPEEIAKAIIEGTLDATDPRMDHYLRISKEFTELLPVDYIGIVSLEDLVSLFLSEQIAAVWGGTWNLLNIEQAPFEYGVTYLPPFTPDDAPGAAGTAYRVGGPSSCGQYGIPQSTAEAGKLDLAVDYLMYMSAPQNFGPVVLAFRAFIPMVAGIEGGDVVDNFGAVAALPERLFSDPGARLTLEAGDAWTTLMQSYFLGQVDEEEAKTGLQEIWMEGALALCADQGYDWCPE